MRDGKYPVWLAMVLVFALMMATFVSESAIAESPLDALQAALPRDVPVDWWSEAQKNIAEEEYSVTWQDKTALPEIAGAYQAPNRAHDLRTYFTKEGPRVIRRTESDPTWTWGLELIGTGDVPFAAACEEIVANGNRIEYRRGDLTEWYLNSDRGIEQGFTINSAIGDGQELVLDLAVHGELTPDMMPDGETIEFLSVGRVSLLRYGHLKAYDANGKKLCAEMKLILSELQPSIRLVVDTTDAEYPVTIDPLMWSGWALESNQDFAQFGCSVATAGDVNGDGYSDFIVGAHLYDNGQTNEGRVFVYYGSDSGPGFADWTAESEQVDARLGWSVSTAGDVNGDGYADILVGAYQYDNAQTDEGAAFVWLGSGSGLGASGIPANADWTAESNQNSAAFAYSASTAGDINGDGYSDVVIGAFLYNNGQSGEGRAFVWLGSASGLGANGTPVNADWYAESNQANANLGFSVSTAGDVNGDGYTDVLVGAHYYDNGLTDEGMAFVWLGSASGLGTNGTPVNADWYAESNQANANLGFSVSTAGDVNGDGYADVLVGAHYYDNGQTNEGRVFLWLGSASGLDANGTPANADWYAESNQVNANLGCSVSTAGDVNGDGYADIVVGAYLYDVSAVDGGAFFVWFGSTAGLGANGTPGNVDCYDTGDQAGARLGISVATAGDLNGDGLADIIVGAYQYDNAETDEGRIYLLLGSRSGLSTAGWTAIGDQVLSSYGASISTAGDVNGDGFADVLVGASSYDNGDGGRGRVFAFYGSTTGLGVVADWIADSDEANSRFGGSLSTAGDVNGDGYADIIVGAPGVWWENSQTGRAYVFSGSATGLSATAIWTAECDQTAADFGVSVSTAGDVNGDGYADVIVGADTYSNGQPYEGRAYLYCGSPSGLSLTANWTLGNDQADAWFGHSVSTAGDVNGDGYADVLIGAPYVDNGETAEGCVYAFYGSVSSLSGTADWMAESDQANAYLGSSVSTAGDVNGDGYADVIVGAHRYDNSETDEGAAFVWLGSASGLGTNGTPSNAAWIIESNQFQACFHGMPVSAAGDVNGDGYADVTVGFPLYDNGETDEGQVHAYFGSVSGLSGSPDWVAEGDQTSAHFGCSVSIAGDVNGDGYSDVIVGADSYDDTFVVDTGCIFLYHGNNEAGRSSSLNPRQRRSDNAGPIAHLGMSDSGTGVRLAALGRTPFGRGKVKLECEVKPLGTPFNGSGTIQTTAWTNTGTAGIQLNQLLDTLSPGTVYHWRVRLLYNSVTTPYQQRSRWFMMPWNGGTEADFRTPAPPLAPSSPDATAIGTDTITWTWQDNSSVETGFEVYADPGAANPVTLRDTMPQNVQQWHYASLIPNTQYAFQVLATNTYGDSAKTGTITAWTLAAQPLAPIVTNIAQQTFDVSLNSGDGNSVGTEYAIQVASDPFSMDVWVQADGSRDMTPVYQTMAAWGVVTVTDLAASTLYGVFGIARNGEGVDSELGLAGYGLTLEDVPPLGTITINDGASFTVQTLVTLALSGTDNASGVTHMRFSTDNATWVDWEAYATSRTWSLSSENGLKTVYVQYRDGAGNVSTDTICDGITLDDTAPVVTDVTGPELTSSATVMLTLSAADALAGMGTGAQVKLSNNDPADWGTVAVEPYVSSRPGWPLSAGDGVKLVYARFADRVGNWTTSTAVSNAIKLDTKPPEFTGVMATPMEAMEGDTVMIAFNVDEAPIYGQPEVTVNGHVATHIMGAKGSYLYWYEVLDPGNDPPGPAHIEISAADPAGNLGISTSDEILTIVKTTLPMPVSGALALVLLVLVTGLSGAAVRHRRQD